VNLLPNTANNRRNSVAVPAAICDLTDGEPRMVRLCKGAFAVGSVFDTATSKFLNQWHWHQNETGFIPSDCAEVRHSGGSTVVPRWHKRDTLKKDVEEAAVGVELAKSSNGCNEQELEPQEMGAGGHVLTGKLR
jgi:hypothetical protein